jgi:Spy/CpxP family protein refolding chaperone
MFRKLILAAVMTTGTAAGLTATPATAAAQPPFPGRHEPHGPRFPERDRHDYAVLVRHRGHWDRYRVFDNYDDARRAVWRLERQGRDARIEVIHRHR